MKNIVSLALIALTLACAVGAYAVDAGGPLAARLARFRSDPAGAILERMETRLGLSAEQRTAIDAVVRPFVADRQKERGRAIGDPVALLAKLESGAIGAADVRTIIDARLGMLSENEPAAATALFKIYALLDGTQRRIVAREALDKLATAGEKLDFIEKLPDFPIATRLGIDAAQAARIRGLAMPLVRDLLAAVQKELGDPAPKAEKFMSGGFTVEDFKALLAIRRTVVAANADRIAETANAAWSGLSPDLKATLVGKLKAAADQR